MIKNLAIFTHENSMTCAEKVEKRLTERFALRAKQARKIVAGADRKKLGKEPYAINLRDVNKKIQNIGAYTAKGLGDKFDLKL